jgi:AcrR family transcriptional regulator
MTTSGRPPAATPRRRRNPRGQGGQLRQELITAARKLLASADAESELTIRGVTRAAGVHPQAFYLHFDNLDALLYEVYAAEFSELTSALQQAAAGAEPGTAALRAMCQEYARFALSQPA